MEHLSWELSVLSRSVVYKNLSAAAVHVGLSQPQLSRITNKLEQELGVVLLDRSVRRKSGWTPVALKLAEVFSQSRKKLEHAIQEVVDGTQPKHVRIASLEGVAPLAIKYVQFFLAKESIDIVELDIHDTSPLEECFSNGDYDLILTSREPGKQKYQYLLDLGRQSLKKIETSSSPMVLSSFEYRSQKYKKERLKAGKSFISNSLDVRRSWLEEVGGQGNLPSIVHRVNEDNRDWLSVLLIGAPHISPQLWDLVQAGSLDII